MDSFKNLQELLHTWGKGTNLDLDLNLGGVSGELRHVHGDGRAPSRLVKEEWGGTGTSLWKEQE